MGGKMRIGMRMMAGACGLACVGMGAPALAASEKPAGGPIQFIVQPGNEQGRGKIIVTGVIGDYGTTSPSKHGGHTAYGIATLKKGTFEVNLTKVEEDEFSKAVIQPFDVLGGGVGDGPGEDIQGHRPISAHQRKCEAHRDIRVYRSAVHERTEEGPVQPQQQREASQPDGHRVWERDGSLLAQEQQSPVTAVRPRSSPAATR